MLRPGVILPPGPATRHRRRVGPLTSILYAVAVLLVGFGVLGSLGRRIVIRTADGETPIQCADLDDEGGVLRDQRAAAAGRTQGAGVTPPAPFTGLTAPAVQARR